VGALANDDVGLLECSAANKLERKRFPNGFGAKLSVNVFEPRNGVTGESNKDVTNDDTRFVRRTFGLNF